MCGQSVAFQVWQPRDYAVERLAFHEERVVYPFLQSIDSHVKNDEEQHTLTIIQPTFLQCFLYLLDMLLKSGQVGTQCTVRFNHVCEGFPRFSNIIISVSGIKLGLLAEVMYTGRKIIH